jgi:hypothetical protein
VVDQVALGHVEPVTQWRVQAGQPDAVAFLVGHPATVPGCGRVGNPG